MSQTSDLVVCHFHVLRFHCVAKLPYVNYYY